ncbi:MAG TPA: phosphatidate cytidylyltransferase, partial [Microbacterium sp.]|nr:phosphatidate cytidylyltransferase [Microbacterium sp.]
MSDDTSEATQGRAARRRASRGSRTPAGGAPLADDAFPAFDAEKVPPRPPLPSAAGGQAGLLDTADHNAIREQWRAARDELGSHVSNARDQLDHANARIKQRTGRDLILAIVIGLAFGAALLG